MTELYSIFWKNSAEKDIKKIDRKYIPKILDEIESLSINPFPIQSKKLYRSDRTYRLRIGNYRVIYQVDMKEKIIIIFHVRHRKEAYK